MTKLQLYYSATYVKNDIYKNKIFYSLLYLSSPIAAGVSLRLMQAESNGVPMAHLLSSGQEISRVLVKLKGNSSEVVSKKPPKWRDENNRVELSRRKC